MLFNIFSDLRFNQIWVLFEITTFFVVFCFRYSIGIGWIFVCKKFQTQNLIEDWIPISCAIKARSSKGQALYCTTRRNTSKEYAESLIYSSFMKTLICVMCIKKIQKCVHCIYLMVIILFFLFLVQLTDISFLTRDFMTYIKMPIEFDTRQSALRSCICLSSVCMYLLHVPHANIAI